MVAFVNLSRAVLYCKNKFKKRLLLSNTLSTMALLGLGDGLTQYIEIKLTSKPNKADLAEHSFANNYDWARSAKVSTVGLLTGPFGHYWYYFLDKKFPLKTTRSILLKVLSDQLIAAPIFNVLFITSIHTLDGKHLRQIFDTFKEKFFTIYAYDCSIWPIVQLINFYFIPTVYRLLYVNFVSLLWNALLSYLMFNDID